MRHPDHRGHGRLTRALAGIEDHRTGDAVRHVDLLAEPADELAVSLDVGRLLQRDGLKAGSLEIGDADDRVLLAEDSIVGLAICAVAAT